jgi:hypothetical protein
MLAGSKLFGVAYAKYDLAAHFGVSEDNANYQALKEAFADLPVDPYARDAGRYRRFARGFFLPWSGEFNWFPAAKGQSSERLNGYYQGNYNPEYPEAVRYWSAVDETVLKNKLLIDIITFDFQQTHWNDDDSVWPLHVGVHLMKLSTIDGHTEAYSSPNELHQDGEPFVFAHLVYRHNAEGGYNLIAPPNYRGKQPEDVPASDRLAEFELIKPLESYAVTDHLATHYVAPIRKGRAPGPGERAVITVDISPMRQRMNVG